MRSADLSGRGLVEDRSDAPSLGNQVIRAPRLQQDRGAGWRNDRDLVFTMPDGRPWHPDVTTKALRRLVDTGHVPRIRLDDLRQTHATRLLATGANLKIVSERLGHASMAFTLDAYGHVSPVSRLAPRRQSRDS